jgi:hypothetical protein
MTSGGNISSDGTFSSSTAGTFKVVGRGRGRNRADTSVVVVVPPAPDLVRVEVTPAAYARCGSHAHLYRDRVPQRRIDCADGVVWSATGGEVDPSSVYTAGLAHGSYRVIATSTSGTLADTSAITINEPAPTLVSVIVSPGSTSLTSGTSKQFKAYRRDSSGDSVAVGILHRHRRYHHLHRSLHRGAERRYLPDHRVFEWEGGHCGGERRRKRVASRWWKRRCPVRPVRGMGHRHRP